MEKKSEIALKSAATVETEIYSDKEIAEWDMEDRLVPAERDTLLKRLKNDLDPSGS
ncbi:MAG: hypothetical protein KGZ49_04735 [Syntrophaceae bacterium]|nr:hypothetical protein [Syntrophaceae bacterium]